jgi:hypothetical protein
VINEVYTMEIVERETKIATGQSGIYLRISMGPKNMDIIFPSH